jgi:two-component system, chemotaxis family, chemotaxis protein CheY
MDTKILVVDDSQMVRAEVDRILTAAGFRVAGAVDGLDALEKLAAAADTRLVVCDVNMPRMNGLAFLERIQRDGMRVPVVMLTTEGQVELIERAKALGAKGWIVKPFKPELLVAAAKKLTGAS